MEPICSQLAGSDELHLWPFPMETRPRAVTASKGIDEGAELEGDEPLVLGGTLPAVSLSNMTTASTSERYCPPDLVMSSCHVCFARGFEWGGRSARGRAGGGRCCTVGEAMAHYASRVPSHAHSVPSGAASTSPAVPPPWGGPGACARSRGGADSQGSDPLCTGAREQEGGTP